MLKNYRLSRRILLNLSLVIGVCFLALSFIFILEPPESIIDFSWLLDKLRETFEKFNAYGLFRTLFFTGIVIVVTVGAPHIFGGLLLVARIKNGIFITMIGSIFLIFFSFISLFLFYDTFFPWFTLFIGLSEFVASWVCYVSYEKYVFYFNELDYNEINYNNKELLIVYYSRDLYIKKYAHELANKYKCGLYEIKTKEDYSSNKGLYKLLYETIFAKKVEVEDIDIDLSLYQRVYLITGVVVRSIAAPALDFCSKSSGKIKSVEYDFIHYTPVVHKYSVNKLNSILNLKHISAKATCMHFGRVINFDFIHPENWKKKKSS